MWVRVEELQVSWQPAPLSVCPTGTVAVRDDASNWPEAWAGIQTRYSYSGGAWLTHWQSEFLSQAKSLDHD
jgi:hypothetical protein